MTMGKRDNGGAVIGTPHSEPDEPAFDFPRRIERGGGDGAGSWRLCRRFGGRAQAAGRVPRVAQGQPQRKLLAAFPRAGGGARCPCGPSRKKAQWRRHAVAFQSAFLPGALGSFGRLIASPCQSGESSRPTCDPQSPAADVGLGHPFGVAPPTLPPPAPVPGLQQSLPASSHLPKRPLGGYFGRKAPAPATWLRLR
ncbi:unnamed protein product [Lampetra fluviatilis]